MAYDLLNHVAATLEEAGLRAGEAYPGIPMPEVDRPLAAVSLRELDTAGGMARFRIQVLSPRSQGGWACQVWAVRAAEAMAGAGMTCATKEMEYLSGSDCFCTEITASMEVVSGPNGWMPGHRWTILCGSALQEGVVSFTAERDLQRRLVGANGEQMPVKVTPGRGGWKLELIQDLNREPQEMAEPFILTVREGRREHRYTGCCWNVTRYDYLGSGLRMTRQGFALGREEIING